jgi:hypothetical protein
MIQSSFSNLRNLQGELSIKCNKIEKLYCIMQYYYRTNFKSDLTATQREESRVSIGMKSTNSTQLNEMYILLVKHIQF